MNQERRKRPFFWAGPFISGFCLAFGYGITQRTVVFQGKQLQPSSELFEFFPFPGISLATLRLRYGVNSVALPVNSSNKMSKLEIIPKKNQKLNVKTDGQKSTKGNDSLTGLVFSKQNDEPSLVRSISSPFFLPRPNLSFKGFYNSKGYSAFSNQSKKRFPLSEPIPSLP